MNKKILTLMAIICFFVASCSKKEKDVQYSCDPVINEWATANRTFNQEISRDSLAGYGLDSQVAIFRSLTSENKFRIFQEKLILLLADSSFTPAEKTHIQQGYAFMQVSYYDSPSDSSVIKSFYSNWANVGVANFGWTPEKIFFIAETWVTKPELTTLVGTDPAPVNSDCSCRSDWYCGNWSGQTCDWGSCDVTTAGCGWFGSLNCRGKCSWEHAVNPSIPSGPLSIGQQ